MAKFPFLDGWQGSRANHDGLKLKQEKHDEAVSRRLGQQLKEARNGTGFTQRMMARTFGLKQSEISKIEAGERDVSVFMLGRLMAVYGINQEAVSWVFTEESDYQLPGEDYRWLDRAKKVCYWELDDKLRRKRARAKAQKEKQDAKTKRAGDGNPQP